MSIRVIVYDDNKDRRESLKVLINMQPDMVCAGIFKNCLNIREEAAQLIEQTAIMQQAREEAKNILAQARQEAAEQKQEIDEYIDSRLATLEVILNKTQEAITRGRERLAGSTDKDVLSQLSDK